MSSKQRKRVRKELTTAYGTEEAKKLEKLIFSMCKTISKNEKTVITKTYAKHSYQKCGELINNTKYTDKIIEDIENGRIKWDSCAYEEYRQKELNLTEIYAKGIEIKDGEFKCNNKKCGSFKCTYYQKQIRSADEPMTTFVTCTICGSQYSFN